MFGGSGKIPQQKQKPLGMDELHASTSEEARPVPWLCGKQRIGLTFISDVFNQKAVSVTQSVGKQKSKVGYNYYASFAALACHGAVDALHDVFLNGESVYASNIKLQALSLTCIADVATFTTKNAHGRTTGEEVIIEGANQGDYNGSAIITVISPTAFTYPVLGSPVTPATGTITARVKLDPVFRDAENADFLDVLIPDYGTMRLYWGTETQEADDTLNASGIEHPPYRGICYGVFDQLFLGFNQTNVPNVELVLSRKPAGDWHALADITEDANPVAALCELLQHPRAGTGIATAKLNTVALLETAAAIALEGVGLSPVLTRQQEARQFTLQLLEYIDGYPTTDGDGKLGFSLARHADGVLPEIGDGDLVEQVNFNPEDWSLAFNETDLKYVNRDRAFKEDMVPHREPFLFTITGEPNKATLERPWITQRSIARSLVKSAGRANALPGLTGQARIRISGTLFSDLAPGALFKFNLSTRSMTNYAFRVIDRNLADSTKPEFTISFRVDRSYLFTPPAPALITVDADSPTVDSDQHTSDQETL